MAHDRVLGSPRVSTWACAAVRILIRATIRQEEERMTAQEAHVVPVTHLALLGSDRLDDLVTPVRGAVRRMREEYARASPVNDSCIEPDE